MSDDLGSDVNDDVSDVRQALAAYADAPPPAGLAAAAIRTAGHQRRMRVGVTGVAIVAALAAAPVAVSAMTATSTGGSSQPAAPATDPLVITAYSGHWNGSLLLDYRTGEYVRVPYRKAVPSPDGTRALVSSGNNSPVDPLRLGVLDIASGEVRWLEGYHGLRGAAWSPDGKEVLVTEIGDPDRALVGFAIVDGETFEAIFVHQADIVDPDINVDGHRYVWSPDGQEIVLTRSTGWESSSESDLTWAIRFYDRSGALLRELPVSGPVAKEAAFSPDGARIAIFNHHTGAPIEIIDRYSGAVLRTLSVPGWDAESWGDLVGWADEGHLLVRSPQFRPDPPGMTDFNLLVIDVDGQIQQEVDLVGWWEELVIAPSDGLAVEAAGLTFGVR